MIVVFGSINLDLVARVPRIPAPGETVAGLSFATAPGGKGANQALAARQTGADVALYGAVGSDAFADAALANLAAEGVNLGGVVRVSDATGIALISVDAHGENAIAVVPGANVVARAEQVPAEALREGTTLLMQLETRMEEVVALAQRARARRARVVLNAAPAAALPEALLRNVDVLVVNESEAAACAAPLGLAYTPEDFALQIHARFGAVAVVTLGARGALACIGGDTVRATPPDIDVVDTTGAGDAFCGSLAAALDRGEPPRAALPAAVHAGALACTYPGAQRVARPGKGDPPSG
ncbi:MAG: ribokinase [Burkholderiales bacterium]|nr:ribokinase [Burkholderiales bacterium]